MWPSGGQRGVTLPAWRWAYAPAPARLPCAGWVAATDDTQVLRTETLEADLQRVLRLEGLPLYTLPHANPTARSAHGDTASPPPTVFTAELLELINAREARLFDEFGYRRRWEPFELN